MSQALEFISRALREALFSVDANARLLSFSGLDLGANLIVEQASGTEGVNELFRFEIDLLSASASLDLEAFIAKEVTLSLLDAEGVQRHWHGLATEAHFLGADGGLARYRLIVEPWLALLARRHDCYLFQDLDVLGIVEALLADYPTARYELRVSDTMRDRLPKYRIRTQWNESDLDFLLRILADDGLSFFFEHDAALSSSSGTRHILVIIDSAPAWKDAHQATIRYHRTAGTEFEDSIHAFTGQVRSGTATVSRSGWNAASVIAPAAADDGDAGGTQVPQLEDYDGSVSLPPTSTPMADALALRSEQAALVHAQYRRRWRGLSSVRTLAPGTVFTLTGHPDWDGFGGARGFGSTNPSARFSIQSIRHQLRNNLALGRSPGDAKRNGSVNSEDEHAAIHENEFVCLAADVPVVPALRSHEMKPGLQTAFVVGVSGEVLTAGRDHVVKLQFHWQRGERANPGGSFETGTPDGEQGNDAGNAPGNERSGTWVRVAQSVAGPDYGEVFLPRIGDEVLVDFEFGDPDRPIVIGQLHNGEDLPPFPAGVDADLGHPGVIAGLHATTLDGAGYNELVFDDASGQTGVRAASSNLSSQLNLGHLLTTRPGMASRGSARGQGFEWVSDGWAVARADQGILLSTTMRASAASTQLDTLEAQSQIKAAQSLTQSLSDVAVQQGARALAAAPSEQAKLLKSLATHAALASNGPRPQPEVAAFGTPLVLLEAPSSIAFATPATMLSFAGSHHQTLVQGDALQSAGKTWSSISGAATSLYTHTGGIAAIAANSPVSIQSHVDALDVLADQNVTITSTDAGITVLASRKIVLLAGGASITLEGENITFACPGDFSVKGADQAWGSRAKGPASLPVLPDGSTRIPHWIALDYRDAESGEPVADAGYEIDFEGGNRLSGVLDNQGKARHDDIDPRKVTKVVYKPRPPEKEKPAPPLEDLLKGE